MEELNGDGAGRPRLMRRCQRSAAVGAATGGRVPCRVRGTAIRCRGALERQAVQLLMRRTSARASWLRVPCRRWARRGRRRRRGAGLRIPSGDSVDLFTAAAVSAFLTVSSDPARKMVFDHHEAALNFGGSICGVGAPGHRDRPLSPRGSLIGASRPRNRSSMRPGRANGARPSRAAGRGLLGLDRLEPSDRLAAAHRRTAPPTNMATWAAVCVAPPGFTVDEVRAARRGSGAWRAQTQIA